MHPLPHHYQVVSTSGPEGEVVLSHSDAAPLPSLSPPEFGGPGGYWSPETLLVGAIADCYALTFRALARAKALAWTALECHVEGTLARTDEGLRFTAYTVHAQLQVPAASDRDLALRLLQDSEHRCLISNSLKASGTLQASVEVDA
ncbi:MAG: OsmC family protein [Proteobacteria bacterium]|nr:OsmC family protein [Pseudomonadota bacterium]MBS0465477.1 OsmC family protein [Pseudomonadota bacterium]